MLILTEQGYTPLTTVTPTPDRTPYMAAYLAALSTFLADPAGRFWSGAPTVHRNTVGRFSFTKMVG